MTVAWQATASELHPAHHISPDLPRSPQISGQATASELHEQLRVERSARLRAEENAAAIMVQQEQRNEARPPPCKPTSQHTPVSPLTYAILSYGLTLALATTLSFARALSFPLRPLTRPSWPPPQLLEARLRELESKLQSTANK